MGDKSAIEWTDATWNPLVGCSKVGSPGCENCYAIDTVHRGLHESHRGLTVRAEGERPDWTGEVRFVPERLRQPLQWRRPRRIFVNSLSDLFHADVDDLWIAEIFAVMSLAPQHQFQVLTKRSKSMAGVLTDPEGEFRYKMSLARRRLQPGDLPRPVWPLPNVWLGTSIETDRYAFRANHLRATPAAVRFLSLEPLLGPLPSLDLTDVDWVIVGGESGPGARPMHPDWARDLRDRCVAAGVPYLFKQWGAWATSEASGVRNVKVSAHRFQYALRRFQPDGTDYDATRPETYSAPGMESVLKVGKHAAGRELDGRTWDEYPAEVA